MSTRRTRAGVNLAMIRRGANGRAICRCGCRREVPKGRRTFFGPDCIHRWRITRDPAYVREKVYERDRGVCASCSLDTVAEFHRLKLLERTDPAAYERELKERKIRKDFKSLWDAEHVRPVADGGGECQLDNYQTLCRFCHRKKTGAENSARSKRKK